MNTDKVRVESLRRFGFRGEAVAAIQRERCKRQAMRAVEVMLRSPTTSRDAVYACFCDLLSREECGL